MVEKKKYDSLDEIFKDEEFHLIDDGRKNKASEAKTAEERLIDSFLNIVAFVEENNREPKLDINNISEINMYYELKGIQEQPNKIKILKPFDKFNLLPENDLNEVNEGKSTYKKEKKVTSLNDILNDDDINLLDDDTAGLFEFKHTPKDYDRASADFVARRKPCRNFEQYKPVFAAVQKELAAGKRKLVPFKEDNLREGEFYVHNGILFLLESVNFTKEEKYFPDGSRSRKDGRTHCIFENGTESNMLYRSVAKALYVNGQVVTQNMDYTNQEFLKKFGSITEEDKEAGYIYVLKSKSKDSRIASISNLYKIGYSKTDITERIKNAEKEPTYLMAPVEYIAGWQCYNLNPQKFEQLIHNFFGKACLEIDVFDEKGKRHTPREWFIAPLNIIEQAITLIISGEIIRYRYDTENETISNSNL
jgi:hypothetical protein